MPTPTPPSTGKETFTPQELAPTGALGAPVGGRDGTLPTGGVCVGDPVGSPEPAPPPDVEPVAAGPVGTGSPGSRPTVVGGLSGCWWVRAPERAGGGGVAAPPRFPAGRLVWHTRQGLGPSSSRPVVPRQSQPSFAFSAMARAAAAWTSRSDDTAGARSAGSGVAATISRRRRA